MDASILKSGFVMKTLNVFLFQVMLLNLKKKNV